MGINRKTFVGTMVGTAATLVLAPLRAWAIRPTRAFESRSMTDALEAQFGSSVLEAGDIRITVPDIAAVGAVVPVTVNFNVPGARAVSILVENNATPLAVSFKLTARSGGLVSTSIRIDKTSHVHAVVKAGGKLYGASKEVKVS